MKHALLVAMLFAGVTTFAQTKSQIQSDTSPAQAQPGACIAVKSIGSHALRNYILIGVAGVLLSREQYQVVDAVNYPAKIGQKFHGSDLQTLASSGTKVAILEKHYTPENLHEACH
jgi:hypothetical protein